MRGGEATRRGGQSPSPSRQPSPRKRGEGEISSILRRAVVDVLDADDVVLAEIGAGLHLDQLEVDLAGIGEAVDDADRQEDRLVLVHDLRSSSPRVTSAVPLTTIQCSARW